MTSRQYFGTDGVRGRVGVAPMTPDFVLRLGWAAGRVLGSRKAARVLIGKDTRRSGYMLESALESGLAAAGVEANLLGPLPTPGVAYMVRALRAQAGAVVSASHNPFHDNGVKFFGPDGYKLDDAVEDAIEELLAGPMECVPAEATGFARRIDDAQGRYIEACKNTFPGGRTLEGLTVVLDCANGAAYRTAPAVLRELGARVHTLGIEPDGFNINRDCGSTHPEALQAAVALHRADVGIALDGDADRCLMVDARGGLIDGDDILYLIARHRQQQGRLVGPVVGTVMSNLGIEQAVARTGASFLRAAVGDRYVMEMLKAHGGLLGGESSGHTLCLDRTTTGDGTVTALQVLAAMLDADRPLGDMLEGVAKFPQKLINVRLGAGVAAKPLLAAAPVRAAAESVEADLGRRGRVLLRASGTEPLIRVMVEADDPGLADTMAERIAGAVRAQAAA